MNDTNKKKTVSIVLPCLNEKGSVVACLKLAHTVIKENALDGEIVFVDNNSSDNSLQLAESLQKEIPQLKIIQEHERGYGAAYRTGLQTATGEYLLMADLDGTYDYNDFIKFISKLDEGYDLVVGNRFKGGIQKGSMPFHHHYIGNPLLSFLVKLFFKIKISDVHCGMRAIRKSAFEKIDLYTSGMEFASEMVIKTAKRNFTIAELPTPYKKRVGESKLHSFTDGWRHVRFILLYSPLILFLLPGFVLFFLGSSLITLFYFTNPIFFGRQFFFHPMFLAAALVILGYQLIFFAGFARIYAITHLGEQDTALQKLFQYMTIEKAGLIGITIALIGLLIYSGIFFEWIHSGFGSLNQIKNSIAALVFIVVGIQTIFSAFMLSILGIKEK